MTVTTASTPNETQLEQAYIELVNHAVAEERFDLVDSLAHEYDVELAALRAA